MSPMKRGKCRIATKGGATLPKVAAVAMLPHNDDKEYVFAVVNGKEKYYLWLWIIIRFR